MRAASSTRSQPQPGVVGTVMWLLMTSGRVVKRSKRQGTPSGSDSMMRTLETEAQRWTDWETGEFGGGVVGRDVEFVGLGDVGYLLGGAESLPLDVHFHGVHSAKLEVWEVLADGEMLLAGA